jgi:hypothetical protein
MRRNFKHALDALLPAEAERATPGSWTTPGKGEKNAPPPAPVILDLLASRPAENGRTSVAPQ